MNRKTVLLAILCQFFLVAGQLFFKRAMRTSKKVRPKSRVAAQLFAGIFMMSLWFFIWINLLEGENLSRIFPFEGLNSVLIVFAAWLFLKERLSWTTSAGVILICAGIFLASGVQIW